jgi:hypothetical protein
MVQSGNEALSVRVSAALLLHLHSSDDRHERLQDACNSSAM